MNTYRIIPNHLYILFQLPIQVIGMMTRTIIIKKHQNKKYTNIIDYAYTIWYCIPTDFKTPTQQIASSRVLSNWSGYSSGRDYSFGHIHFNYSLKYTMTSILTPVNGDCEEYSTTRSGRTASEANGGVLFTMNDIYRTCTYFYMVLSTCIC